MSERIAAEIQIGGKVRRSVAEAICKIITREGVSLEWGGAAFDPKTVDDLVAARSISEDSPRQLTLYDDQASWGEFDGLESFLQKHCIPFLRFTEGKYDYDPEAVAYHPTCGLVQWLTDHNRNHVVQTAVLTPIAASLTRILAEMRSGQVETAKLRRKLQRLLGKVRKCLPPDVPALETFEITDN